MYSIRLFGKTLTPAFERSAWLWALFVVSYFFLLGFPRLFTVTAAVLLLVGIYRSWSLLRQYGVTRLPAAYKVYALVFLLLWLPLLASLADARYMGEAAADTFKILPYFFAGLAATWLGRERGLMQPLVILMSVLAIFWAADVIFQRFTGIDVFGVVYDQTGEARAGAYFKNPAKFGTYLACMGVLALYYLVPRIESRPRIIALWLFFALGLVFSMSRTGWFVFMVFSLPLLMYYGFSRIRYAVLAGVLFVLVCVPVFYYYYQHDPVMQARMDRTLAFLDGMTYDNWNTVLTYRLDLWRASCQMISEHWLNGLGLNAFTMDFNGYPSAPFWKDYQPSHEHQYLLQVMSATGLIGLAGIIALHVVVFLWWRRHPDNRVYALPLAMYLFSMWFPFSSHFSFYSSEWVWANLILLGVLIGGLNQQDGARSDADDAQAIQSRQ